MKSAEATPRAIEVLLVEDSPGDVRLTQEAFRDANIAIHLHVATDGVEAMSFLRREGSHVAAPRPDLILLDLNLPKMDGREVLAHIKENASLKTIPTVILTTSDAEVDIVKSYQLQANCYLSKPVQLDDFEGLVKSINDFWLTPREVAAPSRRMTTAPIRVLLIEDNPGDARLLHEMLNEPGSVKSELTHFDCMNDSLTHLAANTANIILLDLGLPDASGLAAVRQVHAAAPSTPLVILTGLDDESLAVQALQEGAQDYLVKGQIEVHALFRALRHAIERQRIQIETDQVGRHQLQLKDEFLSHVSHELCSPLDAIYQFGTILADQLANGVNTDPRECLEIMLRNVGQLQAMIADLLEATRAQEGKLTIDLQCASVPDALAYTVKTLQEAAKAKGIVLSLDFPPDLPLVYADPTRVHQILLILLDNAVKFTPSDGTITLRARLSSEDLGSLLIEVMDSGCGIDPDMTERIFERLDHGYPGNQAGHKGLGLGLYICKELITRQNGRIWVVSSLQHGSTFSFTLPVFSLAGLLSPLLNHGTWPTDSVALVTVAIDSPGPMLSQRTRDEWARDTRILLQRCLLSDMDVLLPKTEIGGQNELFEIVSFADERGVVVLTGRIREQFRRVKHCQNSALSFSSSYQVLDESSAGVSADAMVAAMAARIEALVKSESSKTIAGGSHPKIHNEETRI